MSKKDEEYKNNYAEVIVAIALIFFGLLALAGIALLIG